jgi:hypothetical protein
VGVRRLNLTYAMLDAWRLAWDAIEMDLGDTARALADEAVRLTGWDRYEHVGGCDGDEIFISPVLPRDRAYFAQVDGDRHLLVNPDVAPMMADYLSWDRLMRFAQERGGGLIHLDAVLADLVVHAVTPPDDLSGLSRA